VTPRKITRCRHCGYFRDVVSVAKVLPELCQGCAQTLRRIRERTTAKELADAMARVVFTDQAAKVLEELFHDRYVPNLSRRTPDETRLP
jgi:hypothetical protein